MDNRLFFPATERNKDSIAEVLSRILLKRGYILEIGSGSGEHAIKFQKCFPELTWQSSDPELVHRKSISSWIEHEELNFQMPQPLDIDVEKIPWELPSELLNSIQGIISINMIHIASWNCTKSLFSESGNLLKNGQFLMLYGPFKIGGKHISQSNELFQDRLIAKLFLGSVFEIQLHALHYRCQFLKLILFLEEFLLKILLCTLYFS